MVERWWREVKRISKNEMTVKREGQHTALSVITMHLKVTLDAPLTQPLPLHPSPHVYPPAQRSLAKHLSGSKVLFVVRLVVTL
jgi:hypothetical protein